MVRLTRIILFSFIFLIFFCAHSVFSQTNNQLTISQKQQQNYQKLKNSSSNLYIHWDKLEVEPDWVRIKDIKIDWQNNNYTDRVFQFLKEYKDIYRINDPQNELTKVKEDKDKLGYSHITFQRSKRNNCLCR